MTPDQLRRLSDDLRTFRSWMDDKPLQLALNDALNVLELAVLAELTEAEAGAGA